MPRARIVSGSPEFSGQVRPQWMDQQANGVGPLAQAVSLQPGIATLPRSFAAIETELHLSGHGLSFIGTERQQRIEGDPAVLRSAAA